MKRNQEIGKEGHDRIHVIEKKRPFGEEEIGLIRL